MQGLQLLRGLLGVAFSSSFQKSLQPVTLLHSMTATLSTPTTVRHWTTDTVKQ